MDSASTDRQRRTERLFAEAAPLPPEARARVLDSAGDPDLRRTLALLLAAYDRERSASGASPGAGGRPEWVGPYLVLRELGRGGMGVVYLAYDPRLDRRVALKLLPLHAHTDGAARRRLADEAKAASALDHPHVATIYEIGEAPDGRLYIAMAFYEGETLQRRIERGPLPVGEAVSLAGMVAEGLAAAHRRGIVHRDVKPANVMVTPEGGAKVVDFGVARRTGAASTGGAAGPGTAAYMSPEQVRGETAGPRSDLWSVGVVLYEMLAGRRPFTGAYEHALYFAILHEEPPPLRAVAPAVPADLERVVARCLAKDPAGRYPDADALRGALRSVAEEGAGEGTVAVEAARLVVLPFVNMSPDADNEYFSDGLTEEVIADLSHLRALRVISRTSAMRLKGTDKDTRTLARELGVRYVVEGSARRAGDALRISAQLIDAHHDVLLWAWKTDGTVGDVFAIQEEVARAVAEALRIRLSPSEARALADRPIPDVRAYEAYLRARSDAWRFSSDGLERAERHIETALAIVGDNELLYSTLGHITAMHLDAGVGAGAGALERVESLADKVFALNPDSARGRWLKAFVAFYRGDLRGAIGMGEEALERAPDDPDTLLLLGYVYAHIGRNADALALFERAADLDPLTPLTQAVPGFVAVLEGRASDAVEGYRRFHEVEPESPFGGVFYGWALAYARHTDEAVRVLHATADRFPGTAFGSLARSLAHALGGEAEAAVGAITPEFEDAARSSVMFAREMAHCYALAGDRERALDWLERAVGLGLWNVPFLAEHDGFLDSLRGDPRFEAVLDRVRAAVAGAPS